MDLLMDLYCILLSEYVANRFFKIAFLYHPLA